MTALPSRNEELQRGQVAPSAFYMVRVVRGASLSAGTITGIVERFGTGDKRSFASGEELLDLIRAWPSAIPRPDLGEVRVEER